MNEDLVAIEDCPECRASLQVPEEQVGGRVECPECGRWFTATALRRAARSRKDDDRPRRGSRQKDLSEASSKKIAAGITGILLGCFGVHKFILGYTTAGLVMCLVSVLTCFTASIVMSVIGLVEGVIYLTKTDEEFHDMYIANQKEWF